ncbi:MAG: dynamin family protein [Nostoc sp.]|uniref:dynamin family protein n=1 Tax=unclassified Nostoc TaxID=2593658 RepID=UPI001D2927A3|nr:dynamin family protein [Nostoc sp. JL34]MBN3887503.1 dynamin family protein [Nostoc sp. JL34]
MRPKKNMFGWFFDNSRWMIFLGFGGTFFTIISILRDKDRDPVKVVAAIIFIMLLLLFSVIDFWKWKKSGEEQSRSFASSGIEHDSPGVITPLHQLCESLLNIVNKNTAIIQRPNSEEDAYNLLQDVRDGVLRIYIFGHQSAGKSTLINALLNSQVSPISSGKMTTCLIRIRHGSKLKGMVKWENESEIFKPDIKTMKNKMAEWDQSPFEHRPREVIIEIPGDIIGIPKLELVDTPGTGSAWDAKYGKNLLDETVNKKIITAAVAILVYKPEQAEMQAHDSLLQGLKMRNIKVLGVCNITPNLNFAFQRDKKDALQTIDKAEHQLRKIANAECHRVVIEEEESLIRLASEISGKTVNEFRSHLTTLISDRDLFLLRQATDEGLSFINELLAVANKTVKQYQPIFNTIKARKTEIKDAITSVRNTITEGFDDENIVVQAAAVGSVTMGVAGLAAIYILGSVVTGGLVLPAGGLLFGGLAGSAIGSGIKNSRLKEFEEKLTEAWKKLQQTTTNAKVNNTAMLSPEVIKEVQQYSSSLSKYQKTLESIMSKVETDIESNLQKIEGYESYRKSEVLVEQLSVLKDQFNNHRFSMASSRGNKG